MKTEISIELDDDLLTTIQERAGEGNLSLRVAEAGGQRLRPQTTWPSSRAAVRLVQTDRRQRRDLDELLPDTINDL